MKFKFLIQTNQKSKKKRKNKTKKKLNNESKKYLQNLGHRKPRKLVLEPTLITESFKIENKKSKSKGKNKLIMTLKNNSKGSLKDDNYLETSTSMSHHSMARGNKSDSITSSFRQQNTSVSSKFTKPYANSNEIFFNVTSTTRTPFMQYMAHEKTTNDYTVQEVNESNSVNSGDYDLNSYNGWRLSGGGKILKYIHMYVYF